MFAETFSKIVAPRAAELGISPSSASRHCSVQGQFDDEHTAIAYCMAYGWRHYASFKAGIDILGLKQNEFPLCPLVVDVGCGPGTALLAFAEWLLEARARPSCFRYVGIDRSRHMLALAAAFGAGAALFETPAPSLLGSAEEFTPEIVRAQVQGCDGVVLTMSYVLHQEFMADGRVFNQIVSSLGGSRLPITILAQDANMPRMDEANLEVWPENHLRAMLNGIEAYGYRSRIWHRKFEARQYVLDERGHATEQPATGRQSTKAIAAKIDAA